VPLSDSTQPKDAAPRLLERTPPIEIGGWRDEPSVFHERPQYCSLTRLFLARINGSLKLSWPHLFPQKGKKVFGAAF